MVRSFLALFIVFINLSLCIDAFASIGVIAPDVKFSSDGQWMAYTLGELKPVILQNLKTKEIIELPMHNGIAIYNGVDFSPDSRIVAATAENFIDGVCFWDVESGKFLSPGLIAGNTAVAFSPKNDFVAAIDPWGKVSIFDLKKVGIGPPDPNFAGVGWGDRGKLLDICPLQASPHGLMFSPDGKLLAVGVGSIYVCDTKTWQVIWSLQIGNVALWPCHDGLDFSPDGNLLATISNKDAGTVIVVLDAKNGTIKKELKSHIGSITAICFSPNGKYLACGSFSENPHMNFVRIEILDIETGNSIREFSHQFGFGIIESIDISPNGKIIVWTTQGCGFMQADVSDLNMGSIAVIPKKVIHTWGEIKRHK